MQGRIRKGNAVLRLQPVQDLVLHHFLIVFAQFDPALLQTSLAVVRPDEGCLRIRDIDHVLIQPQSLPVPGALAVVDLQVDVLAHEQPFAGFQLHVEGIGGGSGALAVHVLGLIGVLSVDGGDGALPGHRLVQTAVHDDRQPLRDVIDVLLVHGSLHPVVPGLHNHDEPARLAAAAVTVGLLCAVLVDALHDAFHIGGDGRVRDVVLQLLDLQLLALDVVLLLPVVDLLLLDLHRVIGSLGGGGRAAVLLQLRDRVGDAGQVVLQPLQVDLGLSQILLIFFNTVGEKGRPLRDRIPGAHEDLVDLRVVALLEGLGLLGLHDAAEPVEDAVGSELAGQLRDGHHIGGVPCVPACCRASPADPVCRGKHDQHQRCRAADHNALPLLRSVHDVCHLSSLSLSRNTARAEGPFILRSFCRLSHGKYSIRRIQR